MGSDIPEVQKKIARKEASVFGPDDWTVGRYYDDNHASWVDVLKSNDSPVQGVTSFATATLSNHPIHLTVADKQLRVELVGACASVVEYFGNILATCAFCVLNDGHPCSPGTIFRDVVTMYEPNSTMKHVLLVSPFLWEREFGTMDFPDRTVTWLQIVPISEAECAFAMEKGSDALENLFEENQIDVFDPYRPSVL